MPMVHFVVKISCCQFFVDMQDRVSYTYHHKKEVIIKLYYFQSCPSGAGFEKAFQNSIDCLIYDLRSQLT
jgi:hypothetical protein